MTPRFGDVLKTTGGRDVTVMIVGADEHGYVRVVTLCADYASARTKWWRPGTTTLLDPYDMRDRFETVEPAPQIDPELAEAFAAVRALR